MILVCHDSTLDGTDDANPIAAKAATYLGGLVGKLVVHRPNP